MAAGLLRVTEQMLRLGIILIIILMLSACTSVRPGPDAFQSAERAIAAAEQMGADDHSPVEMRYAREKLAEARRGMETREYDVALWLIEQSEINAELAIEKAKSARTRQRVNELRQANEVLKADFESTFGEDFQ